MPMLTIGQLAVRTGVNVETIRYYERAGVMPLPQRTEGGHRAYADADVLRLGFVRRARQLGFSLDDVRELLGLVDRGDVTCAEVQERTVRHLAEIRARIDDLQRMERTLAAAAERCAGDGTPDCPILESLYRA